ncbi:MULTISPECIES: NUDIX domain-containing protein [Paenibacillus]|jgi:8-oxo-dGTP diphosphatase|uniref:NUDIX domain-containing protein n=1 Tax=Paenibacillus baimaensis TaxID=2982185 RepID=A0ABT2UFH4_9BACL|nr:MULTISPECIES: NUDIX domain-containing protein [unclassified Paenibacillus]MCU6793396.1 NUDIX domain-containing protein [Paenibacillus sp. WQ 127069]OMF15700.1 NUDIX hydrolase [Paenibacillus sp. FSL H7-0331]
MIRARIMATAMLFHDNDLLMMKRSPTRTLNPGMWAAVGGHLDPGEISSPRNACLREVCEETGLQEEEIIDLKLQYILIRLNQQEIRQQFIYTAHTTRRDVIQTEEGVLHWIPREQVLDREIPFIFHRLLEHYFEHGPTDHIWVGTAGFDQYSAPEVHWTALVDPEMN